MDGMKKTNIVPINIKLNRISAVQEIRRIAKADDGRVRLSGHARDRMKQRGFDFLDIKRCLVKGLVVGDGAYLSEHNDWKAKFKSVVCGAPVQVVAALKTDPCGNSVLVVTLF